MTTTTNDIMLSGELDMAYDESDFTDVAERLWRVYHVGLAVVSASSPGGGWPTVKLIGTRADIARTVVELWKSGDDEMDRELLMAVLP